MKRRILIQTNPPWIKTGLAESGKTLMKYLYKTGKYDLGYYCTQTSIADHNLKLQPWKNWGCLPTDPRAVQELNADPGKARDASYGAWNIDNVIKEFKPDCFLGIDDPWSFPRHAFMDKPWWGQINSMLHITIDSLPILDQALEQSLATKNYYTWAKFAKSAIHSHGPQYSHVGQIYGAMDTDSFSPISINEKLDLRKRFGIDPNTVIFNYVFRNQLRKRVLVLLEAFAQFKTEHPDANVKLHLHTSVSEKAMGWDLPRMMKYYGVNANDVLFTYVCKVCGQWHISPYIGDEVDCPYCGAKKSMATTNIVNGVHGQEMKYVYGISDAALSPHNSGGLELTCPQALLCGLPLACTNYSCGEDFCEQDFVFPLSYVADNEPGTNFIKAVPSIGDIKRFMRKIWKSSRRDLEETRLLGRDWAIKTFGIQTIGKQWMDVFDATKPVDWSSVTLVQEPKNDQYPFPQIEDENQFISALYTNILKMNEPESGDGFRNWKGVLQKGGTRQSVYDFFIGEARKENAKIQAPGQDFWSMLDLTTGRKRVLFLAQQSIGDIIILTSLLESLQTQHPDADIYFMADAKYHELLVGCPYIHKVLPYIPALEQEMLAMGAGQSPKEAYFDAAYYPCLQTQKILSYISQPSPAFSLS